MQATFASENDAQARPVMLRTVPLRKALGRGIRGRNSCSTREPSQGPVHARDHSVPCYTTLGDTSLCLIAPCIYVPREASRVAHRPQDIRPSFPN